MSTHLVVACRIMSTAGLYLCPPFPNAAENKACNICRGGSGGKSNFLSA